MTLVRSTVRGLTLLLFCALPAVASAQPWMTAFQAGEYAKAADLLHEIVSDLENVFRGDPAAFRLLAQMYQDGLGLPRDPIGACSLAQDAESLTQMTPPTRPIQTMEDVQAYDAIQKEAQQFSAAVCSPLSGPDLMTAGRSRGCYGLMTPEETIIVGTQSVRISRAGIALADESPAPSAPH